MFSLLTGAYNTYISPYIATATGAVRTTGSLMTEMSYVGNTAGRLIGAAPTAGGTAGGVVEDEPSLEESATRAEGEEAEMGGDVELSEYANDAEKQAVEAESWVERPLEPDLEAPPAMGDSRYDEFGDLIEDVDEELEEGLSAFEKAGITPFEPTLGDPAFGSPEYIAQLGQREAQLGEEMGIELREVTWETGQALG